MPTVTVVTTGGLPVLRLLLEVSRVDDFSLEPVAGLPSVVEDPLLSDGVTVVVVDEVTTVTEEWLKESDEAVEETKAESDFGPSGEDDAGITDDAGGAESLEEEATTSEV